MTRAEILITVILIQQGLFAAVWALGATLRIARRAAWHWAAAAALAAVGMALALTRGTVPDWLSFGVANLLVIGALLVLRRGIQCFARVPRTDREQLMVLGGAALGLAASTLGGPVHLPLLGLAVSAALAWTLLRAAHEVRAAFSSEVAKSVARWSAMPFQVFGLVFAVRGLLPWVLGPQLGPQAGAGLSGEHGANLAVGIASLVFGLVINLALIGITGVRLIRRLQHQSEHDVLTGVWNRRAMQRWLADEAERQRRTRLPFAVLSIDIDHFKDVNDQHGHDAGDAVLVRVAQALERSLRTTDRVARVGGEEFSVLLPGANEAGAEGVARRLLEAVRALEHPELSGRRVTVSIGVAVPDGASESMDDMLRRLDQALYAAKRGGRDRQVTAPPPMPPAPVPA